MLRRVLLLFLFAFVSPAMAGESASPGLLPPPPPPLPGMDTDRVRDQQRHIIERYYRSGERDHRYDDKDDGSAYAGKGKRGRHKRQLPPGLQKKEARGKELPPGWRMKIARGAVLPRDLRPHIRDLPHDLERDLPRPPRGTRFYQLEDKIIRVVEATFEIVDVFNIGR
ncbi:MAG: hypothetical protein C0613_11325 [Desulfobulbaceae bacterium]|nr:MAG: hypothetical protein C0613_11325 [Desulfobulbaceae bacterium]